MTSTYVPGKPGDWPNLAPLIGGPLNVKLMEQQFDEVMRLTASIKQGTVTASLILRKLAAYPRQNSLAMGLREYGRLERTLFTLKWLRDPALRKRVTGGLNKGEARNALARTVFFHRLGEIRDRLEHAALTIHITGESYRGVEARKLASKKKDA